jgi:non-ribosomal peptide synthetase component F
VLLDPRAAIGSLNLLPEQERNLLLYDFNDTAADYPKDKTIVQLFEEQVEKTPDHIAVVFEDRQLTYRALNESANRVAHCLRERYDIQSDDIVALQLERSEWMITAILGVLKSGGAYLPMAPDAPESRVRFMLQDSAVSLSFDKLFERIKRLPKEFIFFLFTYSHGRTSFCTIGFIRLVKVLTPATTFKAEYYVSTAKVIPRFFNTVKSNVKGHA